MERRFYWGLGILVFFLCLSLSFSLWLTHIHRPLSRQLDQAAQIAVAGNLDEGIRLARQANAGWKALRRCTAAVADHTPMEEIDGLFAEMEIYAQTKDTEHFSACCAQLARLVQSMADAHSPAWENLL